MLRFSADLICTVNSAGRFVDASDASLGILGYTPAKLAGRPYQELILPADLEAASQIMKELLSGQPNVQVQNRYIHKNGQIVPLLWSAQYDEREKLLYCIARSGQVTKQGELMRSSLEDSNLRYQYVSRATSDAIWDWDIVKMTLYWGENFETTFGYKVAGAPPGIDS